MTFTGNLTEFSLPEVFQFIEQGQKTGLLTINTLPTVGSAGVKSYYIWLHQGRIVAAADRLDQKGLISLLEQRNWLSDRVTGKIPMICSLNSPLGLCLKSQGMLQAEQLKLLFRVQVVGQVTTIFELKDSKFEFTAITNLPFAEMTGLSMPASEAALSGLRVLRDWTALTEKLPDPYSGLSSTIGGQPEFKLNTHEWQVWEFANGTVSLSAIAKQLGLALEKVQQIAFCLIVANMAEEVFLVSAAPATVPEITPIINIPEPATASASKTAVSKSFLQNLVGFLKNKV